MHSRRGARNAHSRTSRTTSCRTTDNKGTLVSATRGASSQLPSLIAAGTIAVVMLFFTGTPAYLPNAALAGIVANAVLSGQVQGIIGPLVPEPGFEPGRPCGQWILRQRGKGGESMFSQFVALSRLRGVRGGSYSPRLMVTQMDAHFFGRGCSKRVAETSALSADGCFPGAPFEVREWVICQHRRLPCETPDDPDHALARVATAGNR